MAMVINSNIMSLTSQRALSGSNNSIATAMERLSTGLRINSAKDDAAGLSISERFTAQIRGINQAARNAADGISLSQTAEGDLSNVTNNLQRIRELAVQSANATNSASDRAALQAEVDQLVAEITRVASQSNFNGVNLLDGSFSSQTFQVGANAGQTITVSEVVDARASALGAHVLATGGAAMGATTVGTDVTTAGEAESGVTAETDLTITTAAGTSGAITWADHVSAKDVATAINTAANGLGVTATASNSTTLSGLNEIVGASGDTVTFTLNGEAISAVVTDQNDLTNLVNSINGAQAGSGVTAEFTSESSKASITLSTTDGRDISLLNFSSTGTDAQTISFGGETLTEAADDSGRTTGTVSLASSQGEIQIAGANVDNVFVTATDSSSDSFQSVAAVSVGSASDAIAALTVLDAALGQVNSARADLGAYQNRFESVVESLQTSAENLTASRSRILDADFAAETANLTKAQILQQAGVAMLSQANVQPQTVLALLQ